MCTRFKLLIVTILLFSCGNMNRMERTISIEKSLKKGENIEVIEKMLDEGRYDSKDKLIYYMDNGIVGLYQNDTKKCFGFLEKADILQENLYTVSIGQTIAKNIINDNQVDYSGEDYESLYLNIFKALSFYKDGEDESAKVELRRGLNKMNLFETRYSKEQDELRKLRNDNKLGEVRDKKGNSVGKFNFSESVLLRLINIIANRDENQLDEVDIDKNAIKNIWNNYSFLYNFENKLDFDNDIILENKDKTKEIVDIFAFSGLVAYKDEIRLYVYHSNNFLIVSTSSSNKMGDFLFIPFKSKETIGSFSIAIPVIERRKTNNIYKSEVYINNLKVKDLKLVENISNIAINQYESKKIVVIIRALVRALSKTLSLSLLNNKAQKEGGIYSVLSVAGNLGVAALESADIRGWNTLPDNCYFAELLLDKGKKYDIEIKYLDNYNNYVKSSFHKLDLSKKKENVIIGYGF